jgi:hypothetical protein
MNEIDALHFCAGDFYIGGKHPCMIPKSPECEPGCKYYYSKWPTPEEFEEEYGEEYPWNGGVYYWSKDYDCWCTGHYESVLAMDCGERFLGSIRCACTPWGNPPFDWNYEKEAEAFKSRGGVYL